jgi:uncharacterized protein YcgI (DUF1989 family)
MPETVIQTSPRSPEDAAFSATVEAGDSFVHVLRKGQFLRIVDLEGNQAVDTLFYNAENYADRYSAQDTIREQNNIYLTTGSKLISTLFLREQHGALCHRKAFYARLPPELLKGRDGVVAQDGK